MRCAAGVVAWTVVGQRDRAKYKALDAVFIVSECVAYFLPNRPPGTGAAPPARVPLAPPAVSLVVWSDIFPALSETFVTNEVRALMEAGHGVRVEAGARPGRPERAAARVLPIAYLEDDSIAGKLRDLAWLAARHPLRCLRDLVERRRWARGGGGVWPLLAVAAPARRMARAGERHVHAHFAGAPRSTRCG